jgi:required for meiotic nuclear division protein 1
MFLRLFTRRRLLVTRSVEPRRVRTRNIEDTPTSSPQESSTCRAYCSARQYNLPLAASLLAPSDYKVLSKDTRNFLHLRRNNSDLILLRDGCLVSWGSKDDTADKRILTKLKPAEIDSYEEGLGDGEEMSFVIAPSSNNGDSRVEPGMRGEQIVLPSGRGQSYAQLAFSHGLARSTQLGALEKHLDHYLSSIQTIPIHMMQGRDPPLTAREVMKKHGQLLHTRGLLNLHSDLVDSSPEFYWSRPELGKYFESISRVLDVPLRIRVLNQRLDHASSLIGLMQDHLNTRHGTRMEWIIIALIAVEVIFETVHYLDVLNYVNLVELLGNPYHQPPIQQPPEESI